MSLSAKRLGEKLGLTSEETNVLLKEEGYIDGRPGDYWPTSKAAGLVIEKGGDNGYGGYAFRGWNWLEWSEKMLDLIPFSVERRREIQNITSEQRRIRRQEKEAEAEVYWAKYNADRLENNADATKEDGIKCPIGKIAIGILIPIFGLIVNQFTKNQD